MACLFYNIITVTGYVLISKTTTYKTMVFISINFFCLHCPLVVSRSMVFVVTFIVVSIAIHGPTKRHTCICSLALATIHPSVNCITEPGHTNRWETDSNLWAKYKVFFSKLPQEMNHRFESKASNDDLHQCSWSVNMAFLPNK